MKRAYLFLFLFLITGALRAPVFAQQPATQSPATTRQPFTAETLRRRFPPPASETPVEPSEEFVLRIETVVLRLPDPRPLQTSPWLKSLSSLYDTALFQRQRYRETGQTIEFERGGLYFRQDRFAATKGLILYRVWDDRIDFGMYKRRFQNEASPVRGQALFFGQGDSLSRNFLFSGGRQIFFGVRFNLDRNPQRKD
ncbi:MAG: hypothetical protein ACREBD_12925 [Blastocatellia bacterium]